jgi:L-fuculose-phosphate aldolase
MAADGMRRDRATSGTSMEEIAGKLATAGRILAREGHRDYTRGHVSIRLPGNPERFVMKSQRFGLEEVTADNVVIVDLSGEKVAGEGARHSEAFIHSEIYKARPEVHAVVHTHPIHAVALSALGKPIQPLGQPSTVFSSGLPVFADTIDLITDAARGAAVARCLGPHRAMLLKNHGIVTAGASIEEAVYFALVLEDACRLQLLVEAAGGAGSFFPAEEVAALGRRLASPAIAETTFAYLARCAAAEAP